MTSEHINPTGEVMHHVLQILGNILHDSIIIYQHEDCR